MIHLFVKPLKRMITAIQICAGTTADSDSSFVMYRHKNFHKLFLTVSKFLSHNHSDPNVYSLEINTEVYSSNLNFKF